MIDQELLSKAREIKSRDSEIGRGRLAAMLGISEKRARRLLDALKTDGGEISDTEYKDGSWTLTKPLSLSQDQLMDHNQVLIAFGLDPLKWDVVSFRKGSHEGMAKVDDEITTKTLANYRLVVKPKAVAVDYDMLAERINKIDPRHVVSTNKPADPIELTEIAITDAHFGANTFKDYEQTLDEIQTILMGGSKEVVVLVGSDCIHTNGHKGQTVNGTQLEDTDLNQAWEDAHRFYSAIIEEALSWESQVHVVYIPANHDYDMAWTLAKSLERAYPQARHYTSTDQYKALRFGGVAIGWTHGDKGRQADYDRIFRAEYPMVFANAEVTEIHSGHIHTESVKDVHGVLLRSLPTKTVRTKWTKENGYHSVRRFQVFSYSKNELRSINYV